MTFNKKKGKVTQIEFYKFQMSSVHIDSVEVGKSCALKTLRTTTGNGYLPSIQYFISSWFGTDIRYQYLYQLIIQIIQQFPQSIKID